MTYSIPFNRPCLAGNEYNYIAQAIANGHASGDGLFTRRCHELLERELGVLRALLTTSCTHALELAALLLDCDAGDEIIVPSYTFVSTANAFALRGSRIVFCDIRPDTLNLDESCLESLISAATKAVVPVHYAGVPCAMDRIMEICRGHGIWVVEDNAHALFARFQGRHTGTFGCLAAQSFHETKNFTCGEGGALIVNDPDLVERAIIMRDKGTDRSRFFRGMFLCESTWRIVCRFCRRRGWSTLSVLMVGRFRFLKKSSPLCDSVCIVKSAWNPIPTWRWEAECGSGKDYWRRWKASWFARRASSAWCCRCT